MFTLCYLNLLAGHQVLLGIMVILIYPLAALQPKNIWEFFDGVILQAENLERVCSRNMSDDGQCFSGAPIVTVSA